MKRKIALPALLCAGAMLLSVTACGSAKTTLAAPSAAVPLTYSERAQKGEDFDSLLSAANAFAARFSSAAASAADDENVVLSPVSVYMALALSAACASGETADELYAALGVPRETVQAEFSDFYRSLTATYEDDRGDPIAEVALGNSIWVNQGTPTKEACIRTLAEKYSCYSFAADFCNNCGGANKAVREFVKEQTRGLIDRDFELSQNTLFALINTLYLREIWNDCGAELPLTEEPYAFAQADGTVRSSPLMVSDYAAGRAYEGENFTSFYAATAHGYRLNFLVPKDGFSAKDVFIEANLNALADADYRAADEESNTFYYTRCLFPCFEAEFDGVVNGLLQEMGVARFFRDPGLYADGCQFDTLTEEEVYCETVRHVAKLEVGRRGIEGAAVTVVGMDKATAEPPERKEVFETFPVDRAFAFVLTDRYGVTLFSGIVGKIS